MWQTLWGLVFGSWELCIPAIGGSRDKIESGDVGDDNPIRIPIEDTLDLHAFAPRDIPAVVADYLDAAREAGFREVRLVHGRGIGIQRRVVQSLLAEHPAVESFRDAPDSHLGATLARLRPS